MRHGRAFLAAFCCLLYLSLLAACGRKGPEQSSPNHFRTRVEPPGASNIPFDIHIAVDQFGYRPMDPKVAVIRNPQTGYDAADKFSPAPIYQLQRAEDGEVVYSDRIVEWKQGQVDPMSGDNGWWFDFSSVTAPGQYFVYDTKNMRRSAVFRIANTAYREPLKAAVRMYFYQRSGFPKQPPYVEACWADKAAYIGPGQDTEARDVTDASNKSKRIDVRGGWFDAGDTNKYVTFAVQPVHQLLGAYQQNPGAFTDDFNIPESGNGVPDVLDEVRWEMSWLRRMQFEDGSVALKVGETKYVDASPPSSDRSTRYYVPACTSSTIAASGMYAHAAYVFRQFPQLASDSEDLLTRATKAWSNYHETDVKQTDCDTGVVHAGDADRSVEDQEALAVEAAIYLFAVTGQPIYGQYVQNNYRVMRPYRDAGWSRYDADQGEALLFYTTLPNADPALKAAILDDKRRDTSASDFVYGFRADDDLYRAFMHRDQYHWGSNNPRANYGNTNMDAIRYRVAPDKDESFRVRALGTLHYLHGVNPFAMVYLTNMYSYGATNSVNETYHTWFVADSDWSNARRSLCGPAPGFVVGGPNANAEKDGVPSTLAPPTGQPPHKSYRDWNNAYPDASWAVTEPAIYYQSAYIKLLSSFVE